MTSQATIYDLVKDNNELVVELRKSALVLLKKGNFNASDFSNEIDTIQAYFNRVDSNDISLISYLNEALSYMLGELPKINKRKAVIAAFNNALNDMAEMQSINDFDNDYMSVLASDLMTDLMGDNIETGSTSLNGFMEALTGIFNQFLTITENEEDNFNRLDNEVESAKELVALYKAELALELSEKFNTSFKDVLLSMD